MKLATITKKNLLLLVKSRWWALIVILGPLLLIFLAGLSFDTKGAYRFNIGVYSPSYTDTTNVFIAQLNTGQFRTIRMQTQTECVDAIKLGLVHACVSFPENFEVGSDEKEARIYIDYSKLNLAWIIQEQLNSRVEERSYEISRELTQNILSTLIVVKDDIAIALPFAQFALDNEEVISNTTAHLLFISANNTYDLNSSIVDTLVSKINSVRSANGIMVTQGWQIASIAESAIGKANLDSDEAYEMRQEVRESRTSFNNQNRYIENFFSADYDGSINNTIKSMRNRLERALEIEKTSDATLLGMQNLSEDSIHSLDRAIFELEQARDALQNVQQLDAEDIAQPIAVTIEPISETNSNLNLIFPTLIAISIMLAALLLSTIIIVMEINSSAWFRNVISPTSSVTFFFASYLTGVAIVFVQVLAMLLIASIFFFEQIFSSILTTLLVVFFIASFFIVLGMGIGYLLRTEALSILATTFTATYFLFLSNLLVPIENMPELFLSLVQYNPFIISVSLLRKSILFDQPLTVLFSEILVLQILIIALLALYVVVWRFRKRGWE